MSQHILIDRESFLAANDPSQTAVASHRPAREDSAPHCGTEFLDITIVSIVHGVALKAAVSHVLAFVNGIHP
jgi:hypothetical protein